MIVKKDSVSYIYKFFLRFSWVENATVYYFIALINCVVIGYFYVLILFPQICIIFSFLFYAKRFIDDMQHQFLTNIDITDAKKKILLIDMIKFQMSIRR